MYCSGRGMHLKSKDSFGAPGHRYTRTFDVEKHVATTDDVLIRVVLRKPGCSKCGHGAEDSGGAYILNQKEVKKLIKSLQFLVV